jgi:hypothetical protein
MDSWIYLDGGPLDGQAITTRRALGKPDRLEGVEEYVWTPERRTSSVSGRTAQVWRHKSKVDS